MVNRINRAIDLLAQDQAIYYVGGHTGHTLTYASGGQDANAWAAQVKSQRQAHPIVLNPGDWLDM